MSIFRLNVCAAHGIYSRADPETGYCPKCAFMAAFLADGLLRATGMRVPGDRKAPTR